MLYIKKKRDFKAKSSLKKERREKRKREKAVSFGFRIQCNKSWGDSIVLDTLNNNKSTLIQFSQLKYRDIGNGGDSDVTEYHHSLTHKHIFINGEKAAFNIKPLSS